MKHSKGLLYGRNIDGSVYVAGLGKCTDTNIVIPPVYKGKNVTSIGEYAFHSCDALTSITIPNSVTSIRKFAFTYCTSLTSINIPNSVVIVGRYAFYNCTGLTSVTIENGVMSIGVAAFWGCSSLRDVTIPNGLIGIGDSAFYYCINLKSPENKYKAFSIVNGKLKCRNKTYAVDKKSMCRGSLSLCENGIHYCTNIFDIFNYYSGEYGKYFVIGICDVSDKNIGGNDDSKRCARWVIPNRILTREEVINIMNGKDISE